MKKLLVVLLVLLYPLMVFADPTVFNKIGCGQSLTTTPGTAVQLSSTSKGCSVIYISPLVALSHEVGRYASHDIYIGDKNVYAGGRLGKTRSSNMGVALRLSHDSTIMIPAADLSLVYIDTCNTGDGVSFMYLQ